MKNISTPDRRQNANLGNFNIMLSAAGRRVSLMRLLQQSLAALELPGKVLATDINRLSPAMQCASESVVVPPYRDPNCLQFLLDLCREHQFRLIVPTIDPELPFYARHVEQFRAAGCRINISSPATIEIGSDKQRTHDWLTANNFPTVWQASLEQALSGSTPLEFPLLVKPRFGSASFGVGVAKSRSQLEARVSESNMIVQSIARGHEYTVDVFIDRNHRCRCAVPRRRIETRGGEVSKGMTVREPMVADLARQIAETLPGAYGVLNIQIFYDTESTKLDVIEINPRFGGGYPLAHEAGATMSKWLLEDLLELPSTAHDDQWKSDLVMLRYDEAVFADVKDLDIK